MTRAVRHDPADFARFYQLESCAACSLHTGAALGETKELEMGTELLTVGTSVLLFGLCALFVRICDRI